MSTLESQRKPCARKMASTLLQIEDLTGTAEAYVLDLTSHPALDPCPVKLGREPKMAAFGRTLTGHKNSRI